ncbi:MAG: hypothetical protein N2C14_26725 [Planctomycetales bacterium]
MTTLELLLIFAGAFHFCLLPLSFSVPKLLNFREELEKLDPFVGQIFKVYSFYIFLTIIALGGLTLVSAHDMVIGQTTALGLAVFAAVFWTLRLIAATFYYHPKEHLHGWFRHVGYRVLTCLFLYWSVVYWTAVFYGATNRWG